MTGTSRVAVECSSQIVEGLSSLVVKYTGTLYTCMVVVVAAAFCKVSLSGMQARKQEYF